MSSFFLLCLTLAPCEFEGEEYEAGSTVTLGCRSCRCTRGTMSCVYPEECEVLEATEECPHPTATPDPDGGCCPIWTCGGQCGQCRFFVGGGGGEGAEGAGEGGGMVKVVMRVCK